jgi:hypothetical protein
MCYGRTTIDATNIANIKVNNELSGNLFVSTIGPTAVIQD